MEHGEYQVFVDMVTVMRITQKEYFKTRTRQTLLDARNAEKAVDAWLKDVDA